jgi:hypothetical protein
MIFGGTLNRADDCIIYWKITNKNDIEKLQRELDTLREWAVENGMKINPGKTKAIRFLRVRFKNLLDCPLGDKKFQKRAVVNTWE